MFLGNLSALLLTPFLLFPAFDAKDDMSVVLTPNQAYAQEERSSSTWNNAWWNRDWNWSQQEVRPHIDDVDPDEVSIGESVTLTGEGFTDESVVQFGRGEITEVTVSDDGSTLSFTIPPTVERDCVWNSRWCRDNDYDITPGTYRVQVENDYRSSNTVHIEVIDDEDSEDDSLSITEIEGPTQLATDEEGTWTVSVEGTYEGNLQYSVKWGDESLFRIFNADDAEMTQNSATFTHTYDTEGTYTPEFTVTDSEGNTVSSEVSVTVSDEMDEMLPIIDSIDPVSATSGSEVTIYGEGFDADSSVSFSGTDAKSSVESDSKITITVPDLDPGTYRVTVLDDDGRSNAIAFTVEEEATSGRLSVSGISAPTTLLVGEEGTWTVSADTNLDGNLTYSVVWGDEDDSMMSRLSAEATTQSSATFTHTYDTEGTYTPEFTVTDSEGNTAEVSASVVVETE